MAFRNRCNRAINKRAFLTRGERKFFYVSMMFEEIDEFRSILIINFDTHLSQQVFGEVFFQQAQLVGGKSMVSETVG